jgi:hypothetical protein
MAEALGLIERRASSAWSRRRRDGEGGQGRAGGYEKIGGGYVTRHRRGDVAAVKGGDRGRARGAERVGELVSVT